MEYIYYNLETQNILPLIPTRIQKSKKEKKDMDENCNIRPSGKLLELLLSAEIDCNGKKKPIGDLRANHLKTAIDTISRILYLVKMKSSIHFQKKGEVRNWEEYKKNVHKMYTNISAREFRKITANWKKYRKVLINTGILEVNKRKESGKESYMHGVYSKSYRIAEKWNKAMHFEISKLSSDDRVQIDLQLVDANFGRIAVEREWTDSSYFLQLIQAYNFNGVSIDKVTESYTGRHFNKVNRLPRELREYITIDKRKTVELDIKACSFTLLYSIIDPAEKKKMKRLLKGDVYINIGKILKVKDTRDSSARAKIKGVVCIWITSNRQPQEKWPLYDAFTAWFRKTFPKSAAAWDKDKRNIMQEAQKIESDLICRVLKNDGVSIHDGILVKRKDAPEIKSKMKRYMLEEFGLKIKVKG